MGGKRKQRTKWTPLPIEPASLRTRRTNGFKPRDFNQPFQRRISDPQRSSDSSERSTSDSPVEHTHPEEASPRDDTSTEEGSPELTLSAENPAEPPPGCYVNGLWIPQAQLHRYIQPQPCAHFPMFPAGFVYPPMPFLRLRSGVPFHDGVVPPDAHYFLQFLRPRPPFLRWEKPCAWHRPYHSTPYWRSMNEQQVEQSEDHTATPASASTAGSDDIEDQPHNSRPPPYVYPGYTFGPPMFGVSVPAGVPEPISFHPVAPGDSFAGRKKKRRRRGVTNLDLELEQKESRHTSESGSSVDEILPSDCVYNKERLENTPSGSFAAEKPLVAEPLLVVKNADQSVELSSKEMNRLEVAGVQECEPVADGSSDSTKDTTHHNSKEIARVREDEIAKTVCQNGDTSLAETTNSSSQASNMDYHMHTESKTPHVCGNDTMTEIDKPALEVTETGDLECQLTVPVTSDDPHQNDIPVPVDLDIGKVTSLAVGCNDDPRQQNGTLCHTSVTEEPHDTSYGNGLTSADLPHKDTSSSDMAVERESEKPSATLAVEQALEMGKAFQLHEHIPEHAEEELSVRETLEKAESVTDFEVVPGVAAEGSQQNGVCEQESAIENSQIGHLQLSDVQHLSSSDSKIETSDAEQHSADVDMVAIHRHIQTSREDEFPSIDSVDSELQRMVDVNLNDPLQADTQSCTSYVNHSETLLRDMEVELTKLQSLTAGRGLLGSHSIYKLAYDDGEMDQSETGDLDLDARLQDFGKDDPLRPGDAILPVALSVERPRGQEENVYLDRCEILVHEMDSASEAGSEDVELLPHRYESQSILEQKHIYVNKLSLATELLRTKEALPYDEEFKRIVDGEEVCSTAPTSVLENFFAKAPQMTQDEVDIAEVDGSGNGNSSVGEKTSARQKRMSAADSGVQSEESSDEVAEEAKESQQVSAASILNSDDDEEDIWTKKISHKVNGQPQDSPPASTHKATGKGRIPRIPLAAVKNTSLNPCFCCVIM